MTPLPVIAVAREKVVTRKSPWAPVVHVCRVAMVIGLLWLLRTPQHSANPSGGPPSMKSIRVAMPNAATVAAGPDSAGAWSVFDGEANPLGRVARTMPQAASVRGYRGPTEALLVIGDDDVIDSATVFASLDTAEHVQAVREDREFFDQFRGWKLNDPASAKRVDGVTGATLTSLALAGGVLARLGATQGSLVFPESLTKNELESFSAKAATGERAFVGQVYRSGLFTDDITGYQGPTEMRIAVTGDGITSAIEIRRSFDNEPYVEYVRSDKYFWKTFRGKTIDELAKFDSDAAGVEGVSGATMTSQAVAATIPQAARGIVAQRQRDRQPQESRWQQLRKQVHASPAEIATVALLVLLAVLMKTRVRNRRGVRVIWLMSTIGVLGWWTGNMISMSLLGGWAMGGVAWEIAPGLALLVFVGLLWPPLTKHNVYCNHLCPHGAIQQLIRPTSQSARRLRISTRTQRFLKFIAPLTLVAGYVAILIWPSTDLAGWEPFHAYRYPIAGAATIVIAVASLLVSALVPMAYCRFGCPTGSLIDYLRRTATSEQIRGADLALVLLLVVAIIIH